MPRRRKNGADQPQPIDGGSDGEDRTEQSNSALRADTIRTAMRWLADKEAERKQIGADIAAYKQTHIKGDLGFKIGDWNTLFRMYQLEGDDRDKLIDTIREGFAALGLGEQGSFLDAMDPQPEAEAAPKRSRKAKANGSGEPAPVNEAARQAGRADGMAGERTHEAEWPQGQYGAGDYALGFDEGVEQRERAGTAF